MCGGMFGGSKSGGATTLVTSPAATNVAQNAEDKTAKAVEQDKKNALKYGAAKTKATEPGLGSVFDDLQFKSTFGE